MSSSRFETGGDREAQGRCLVDEDGCSGCDNRGFVMDDARRMVRVWWGHMQGMLSCEMCGRREVAGPTKSVEQRLGKVDRSSWSGTQLGAGMQPLQELSTMLL